MIHGLHRKNILKIFSGKNHQMVQADLSCRSGFVSFTVLRCDDLDPV